MENGSRFLAVVVMLVVIVVLGFAVYNSEIVSKGETGRYQVATSYRSTGNWVFVTVIDTRTGEIVRQDRYSGFGAYQVKKAGLGM